MPQELYAYSRWAHTPLPDALEVSIVFDVSSPLNIADADSDVLFPSEAEPLTEEEYSKLKRMALRSAEDFYQLYLAIPYKDHPLAFQRKTFYGQIPCTAKAIYQHTKNVNSYYFGEIGVEADNNGTIHECRLRGFQALESMPDYLLSKQMNGSFDEVWSVRKVLRRFIWHDRIHAKAMYRRSIAVFGPGSVPDIFSFEQKK